MCQQEATWLKLANKMAFLPVADLSHVSSRKGLLPGSLVGCLTAISGKFLFIRSSSSMWRALERDDCTVCTSVFQVCGLTWRSPTAAPSSWRWRQRWTWRGWGRRERGSGSTGKSGEPSASSLQQNKKKTCKCFDRLSYLIFIKQGRVRY